MQGLHSTGHLQHPTQELAIRVATLTQGCPASPRVFCLFFDRVRDFIAAHAPPSRHAHTPFLALLTTFILLYANDVVLIADSPERLQQLLHAFAHFADMNWMHIR